MVVASAIDELRCFFERNGYVRRQLAHRLEADGPSKYKKGDEVRLVANTRAELKKIRRLLVVAGFEPARPFAKGNQHRQPIYGRETVEKFLALIGAR